MIWEPILSESRRLTSKYLKELFATNAVPINTKNVESEEKGRQELITFIIVPAYFSSKTMEPFQGAGMYSGVQMSVIEIKQAMLYCTMIAETFLPKKIPSFV